jgi:tRNA threonylcarbamoyladenosine biosynthesis protein TsaB
MNILAMDTSRDVLEVAVRAKSGTFLDIRYAGLKHSEQLMPVIDTVLRNANITPRELSLIICAKGPGSFTGLRIGMSTAKGIAAAVDCPLVSVPTLDAMAFGYEFFDGVVVPIIDAKKRRVYASMYTTGIRIDDYLDIAPSDLVDRLTRKMEIETGNEMGNEMKKEGKCLLLGGGVHLLPPIPGARFTRLNTAPLILRYLALGEDSFDGSGSDSEDSGPMYLRKSDAELSLESGE